MFLDFAVLHAHHIVREVTVWSARSCILIRMLPCHDDIVALRKCNWSDGQLTLNRPWMGFAIGGDEFLQAAGDLWIVLDKRIGHVLRRQVHVTECDDFTIPV